MKGDNVVSKKILRYVLMPLVIVIAIFLIYLTIYHFIINKESVLEKDTLVAEIEGYNYELSLEQSELFYELFYELNEVLSREEVDYNEYAILVAKLFIADFYNLNNKVTKNNVGGVQFIYTDARDNFIVKAKDTIYKYVESNIYGDRTQELPSVINVEILDYSIISFKYFNQTDEKAHQIYLLWDYDKDLGYQNEAVLTLVNENNQISIIEVKEKEV